MAIGPAPRETHAMYTVATQLTLDVDSVIQSVFPELTVENGWMITTCAGVGITWRTIIDSDYHHFSHPQAAVREIQYKRNGMITLYDSNGEIKSISCKTNARVRQAIDHFIVHHRTMQSWV